MTGNLLEKAATIKRFEYLLLGTLKAQTGIAKKQHQKLDNDYKFGKESIIGKYNESDLIYDTNHSFYKYYRDSKKIDNLSFRSKYSFLHEVLHDLKRFSDLKLRNGNTKNKKIKVFDTSSELYNKFLNKHLEEYYDLEGGEKEDLGFKFMPINLRIKGYDYNEFHKEISDDDFDACDSDEFIDISDMPPLEGDDEEVKEGKGLNILTPNKLLIKLPILLAQIKDGKKSYKLKNEIIQILHLLYQHNKITKKVYNNLIKSL